jgi:hypothetical protein
MLRATKYDMAKPPKIHIPGIPRIPEPPDALVALASDVEHPLIRRSGITCTSDGHWALFVSVPKSTNVPVKAIEKLCAPFPVVYEMEPDEPLQPFSP